MFGGGEAFTINYEIKVCLGPYEIHYKSYFKQKSIQMSYFSKTII
jgi:hypothetical protein